MSFQDKGFVGFFVGQHEFTIECYDNNNLFVRAVDDQNRAWYIWLTDQEISTVPSKDIFTNLVWQEEFNYNGKIDSNKWVYEIRDQWYNQELQATTDRLDNVIVQDGKLRIIAKREDYNGKSFTSGRIKSNGKFDLRMVVLILGQNCLEKRVLGQLFGFWVQIMMILIGLSVEKLISWSMQEID